ncbi:hypothetical protein [Nocardia sp. CY41]|uniref:hypothetical protein n=1 Tax=Nocardia sp. CY41 TaxID=2608686 RepID=UPI0013580E4A|nr:hypothetical protein [Nocardia sp. CY41]
MERITCRTCDTCVLVEKYSPQHTSVQWTTGAVAACAEFAGADSARVRTCVALRDSIDAAVAGGRLGIGTRDGDVP